MLVGPYCLPAEILQCAGRGGRPEGGDQEVRRSVCYVMYNKTDLASHLISNEVKEFLTTTGCKKKQMASLFGFNDFDVGDKTWCCINCSGVQLS